MHPRQGRLQEGACQRRNVLTRPGRGGRAEQRTFDLFSALPSLLSDCKARPLLQGAMETR